MKTLELNAYGVQEMKTLEKQEINGGMLLVKIPMWLKVTGTIAIGGAAGYATSRYLV